MRRLLAISLTILALVTTLGYSNVARADEGDTMNFHFGPISLLVGSLVAGLDFQVNENWTLGPQGNFWKINLSSTSSQYTSDFAVTQYAIGARGNWFKNGVFTDGLYLAPELAYKNITLKTRDSGGDVTGSLSGLFLSGLVGYGWFWNSFNMQLGIGYEVGLGDQSVQVRGSNGSTTSVSSTISGIDGEFQLGWTF